jgi:hypothetical protein
VATDALKATLQAAWNPSGTGGPALRGGWFRHETRGLFEDVQNGAGAEDAVALAYVDLGQDAAFFQCGNGAHDGVVGYGEATLCFRVA